jgi:hypothetical protein
VLTFLKNADNSSLYIDITLKVEGQIWKRFWFFLILKDLDFLIFPFHS